jgi:Transposase DNA-binding
MPSKHVRARRGQSVAEARSNDDWVDRELADCDFKDERLGKRFRSLLEQLSASPGESIALACQDWANTKAAYRFLDNDRVNEAEILAGHFQATRDRTAATDGRILVLHDTTEFSYKREDIEAVGKTRIGIAGADYKGRPRYYTGCGILMHSSLAVTTEGLPLGLTAIKFWSREKFHGANALKKHINPTRVPIEEKESIRWLDNLRQSTNLLGSADRCVHVGDRESDIYELFCTAKDAGTHFLLRTCVDRLAGDGSHTIAAEMAETHCRGLHRVEVLDRHGAASQAVLELKFRRVRVLPPIGKQSRYPALDLTVLHATERSKPSGRDRIDWKLITDLPVTSRAEAIEKLRWYAMRWKIGVSREGHVFKSVKVRPRSKDSGLVAWEAPLRESKTVEPSDNILSQGVCAKHPVVSRMNAEVASLHAFPVAETVDIARKQQVPTETSPMRRHSPAGYQRRQGANEDVETGEALDVRGRNLLEET